MPTYQYRCTECGRDLEVVQKFSDPSLTECPECAGVLRKVFNAVGVVFKGSGFYRNDSRASNGDGANGNEKKSGDKAGEKSGGGDGTSGESKPSEAKPAAAEPKPSPVKSEAAAGSTSGSSTGAKAAAH